MELYKSGLFLLFTSAVLAESINEKPCLIKDVDCVKKNTQKFLETTSAGIATYGIKAIDPLLVEHLDVDLLSSHHAKLHLHNVNITGLKQLQIDDFTMDAEKKEVKFSVKMKPTAACDASYVLENKEKLKTFKGNVVNELDLTATVSYNYDIVKDDQGVDHYKVGPETVTYKLNAPIKQLVSEIKDQRTTDEDLEKFIRKEAEHDEVVEQAFAKQIVDSSVPVFVHNIRQSAKLLPMSAFFIHE